MRSDSIDNNIILVIVGMCGAGKSSVGTYIQRKGWQLIHFGEVTIRELESRGLSINEFNERVVREELRERYGTAAYAKILLPRIREALSIGSVVIDGLYSWAEYKLLRQELKNQMYVLAVFTPRSLRYERLSRRPNRRLSFEEAESRDFAEIENLEKGGPIAMADFILVNDESEEVLFMAVDRLLVTLNLAKPNTNKIIEKGD